jgi:pimeloyl-ACP methyl ester carboxylesterase
MDNEVPFRTRYLNGAGSLRLALHCWGQEGAAPVLFLHGFGQTAMAWTRTATTLASHGHHCCALDFRGHGDSDWHRDGDYSLEDHATDLHRVLARFDRPPLLVGASLGGLLAMLTEGEGQGGFFEQMVLVDITPRWESDGTDRILSFMEARPDGFESLDEAAELIARYLPHRERRSNTEGLKKVLRKGSDDRYRWHWDPRLLHGVREHSSSYGPRLLKAAGKLSLPLLLISGGRSDVVSEHTIEEFLELAPHAVHSRLGDAHHMVAGDDADQFTQLILDFLDITSESKTA